MDKLSSWLFLLIALVWLLPLIGVVVGNMAVHDWIAVLALIVIGAKGLMNK
ncbi:MAG: hypothetical protein Q8P57_00295 [Candidatus Pacearchaeota archaeon]|nr:hypothetical protein [Candidatus Pacearchaeota archaeon]